MSFALSPTIYKGDHVMFTIRTAKKEDAPQLVILLAQMGDVYQRSIDEFRKPNFIF